MQGLPVIVDEVVPVLDPPPVRLAKLRKAFLALAGIAIGHGLPVSGRTDSSSDYSRIVKAPLHLRYATKARADARPGEEVSSVNLLRQNKLSKLFFLQVPQCWG